MMMYIIGFSCFSPWFTRMTSCYLFSTDLKTWMDALVSLKTLQNRHLCTNLQITQNNVLKIWCEVILTHGVIKIMHLIVMHINFLFK